MRVSQVLLAVLGLPLLGGLVANAWVWASDRDLARLFARELQREEAIDRRFEVTQRNMEAKWVVAAELTTDRLSLREAAERFQELHARYDDGNDDLLGPAPRPFGEEGLCRSVLVWTLTALRDRPGGTAVRARLGREYRVLFGHDPAPMPWEAPLASQAPPAATRSRP